MPTMISKTLTKPRGAPAFHSQISGLHYGVNQNELGEPWAPPEVPDRTSLLEPHTKWGCIPSFLSCVSLVPHLGFTDENSQSKFFSGQLQFLSLFHTFVIDILDNGRYFWGVVSEQLSLPTTWIGSAFNLTEAHLWAGQRPETCVAVFKKKSKALRHLLGHFRGQYQGKSNIHVYILSQTVKIHHTICLLWALSLVW